ncbi:MAG TPA: AAA family ATPase [Bryobacteraceae bacterium]|nr:AAA family ATPase [Bryobacteraceae bacterium]
MIRRLYVHNFRCLENFELPVSGLSSALLIGKNGSGKSTVGLALEILQRIGRGTNRVHDLVKPKDLARGRTDVPMRFVIEAELEAKHYQYDLAFDLPNGSKELRVLEEKLEVDGKDVYTRDAAQVHLKLVHPRSLKSIAGLSSFPIAQHLVALPIIQQQVKDDPLFVFKQWLSRMLVFRPIPSLILGDSTEETLEPNLGVSDFGAWFSGVMAFSPSAYSEIDKYLKQVMPDLQDIKNPEVAKDSRSLVVQFSNHEGSLNLPFEDLSDGEKCFMICALVLAANKAYGPVLCFWDEPDNYLAPSEVGHFVLALRKAFQSGGQFIATSHNPEAIRRFSDENTLVLYRRNHLEPTQVRRLNEVEFSGDLVGALVRGDLDP